MAIKYIFLIKFFSSQELQMLLFIFFFSDGGNVMRKCGKSLRQKIKQFVHIVSRIDLANLWEAATATAAAAIAILIK